MGSWNLPPGCTSTDFPGAVEQEALEEALVEAAGVDLDDAALDKLVSIVRAAEDGGRAEAEAEAAAAGDWRVEYLGAGLVAAREAIHEAHRAWDADKTMRVGKVLIALLGGSPGYREDTDRFATAVADVRRDPCVSRVLADAEARIAQLEEQNRLLRAERAGDVWVWQGDEGDDPASLAEGCAVLMSSAQARALARLECGHPAAALGRVNADDKSEPVHCLWCGDIADLDQVLRNLGEVYDHVTGGRISKPLTHAAEVIREAERVEEERTQAAVDELTLEVLVERDALARRVAELEVQIEEAQRE